MGVLLFVLGVALLIGAYVAWKRERPKPLPLVTDAERRNTRDKLRAAELATEEMRLRDLARARGDTVAADLHDQQAIAYRMLSRLDEDGLPQR